MEAKYSKLETSSETDSQEAHYKDGEGEQLLPDQSWQEIPAAGTKSFYRRSRTVLCLLCSNVVLVFTSSLLIYLLLSSARKNSVVKETSYYC